MRIVAMAVALFVTMTSYAAAYSERFEQSLKRLGLPDRLEQLCDYAAMKNIRESTDFRPDRAVAGALAEPRVDKHTIVANGAAFRSRKKWYALSFTCTASPDHLAILGFKFAVGGEIPEDKWVAYGLWN